MWATSDPRSVEPVPIHGVLGEVHGTEDVRGEGGACVDPLFAGVYAEPVPTPSGEFMVQVIQGSENLEPRNSRGNVLKFNNKI